ncbi:MAG: TraR/DksA C4-type zinc finger protein [Actinomycetota bacterium]|nr:TraR/DksA C4-type zinc finger protein [Actinomycetota bacterium]
MSSSTMPTARDTPALAERQVVLLRDLLEAHRSFRCDQLDQLRRAGLLPGRSPIDREINEALVDGARAALREIMQALRRMDDGTYGNCLRCLQPLPIERLEVLPQAALCMACQHTADVG